MGTLRYPGPDLREPVVQTRLEEFYRMWRHLTEEGL